MAEKIYITWEEVFDRLKEVDKPDEYIYGVPKGGMILTAFLENAKAVFDPSIATLILDDIEDTGKTRRFYERQWPGTPFKALYKAERGKWYVFPWEAEHPAGEDSIEQNIVRLIEYIGDDPSREGLRETPSRVVRAFSELFSGYKQDPSSLFTTFDSDGYDQIVLLKDVEVFSMCEHHMLPFFGRAHVAYIPNDKIIGVSKLARLVNVYARRLQIQERICEQVTDALMKYLQPKGAACVIEAVHMCMRMRGVNKQNSVMVTSSLKGVFLEDPAAKAELMQLIKGGRR